MNFYTRIAFALMGLLCLDCKKPAGGQSVGDASTAGNRGGGSSTNSTIENATVIRRGAPFTSELGCSGNQFFRVEGATVGATLRITLNIESTTNYQFCNHGAFPDPDGSFRYTELMACSQRGSPAVVDGELTVRNTPPIIRLWRNGAPSSECVSARFSLTAN